MYSTRSEINGTKTFKTMKEAFEECRRDKSIWKISTEEEVWAVDEPPGHPLVMWNEKADEALPETDFKERFNF